MENKQFLCECNHCGNKGLANLKGSFSNCEEDYDSATGQRFFICSKKWLLLQCPVCGEGILALEEDYGYDSEKDFHVLYPIKTIEMKNTPKEIKNKFEGAIKNYNIDNEICIMALRMVLELICKEKGVTGNKLYLQINELASKGVFPAELKDCSDLIRLLGNAGAHSDVGKISKWEIKDCISFVEFIIMYLYEIPLKINKLKEKYKDK